MRTAAGAAVLAGALVVAATRAPAGGTPPLPDLVIGARTLRRTLAVSSVEVAPGDCTVVEGCVRGLGSRRTLVFDTEIINQGNADVVLGDPHDHPELFEFSPCHGHYHLKDSIHYALSHGGSDTVSLYDDAQGLFHIRNDNAAGGAEDVFALGPAGRGLIPIAGDWDGDGTSTAGLYDPATGLFRLTNAAHSTRAEIQFTFRPAKGPFLPVAGDWDGGGRDSVGLFDPATGTFHLRSARPGAGVVAFPLGRPYPGWLPLAGDWYGDDVDGVGLYNPADGTFVLMARSRKLPPLRFAFGPPGMRPIVGDWDRDGVDTIGVYDPATGTVLLQNANDDGAADVAFTLAGGGSLTPVVGDWDYEDGVPLPAVGYKQAFCWVDHHRVSGNRPLRFDSCNTNQGISVGWADVYVRGLDCQWIDIEGLPGGNYQLRVAVNEGHLIAESDYTNNATRIKVHIPSVDTPSPSPRAAP